MQLAERKITPGGSDRSEDSIYGNGMNPDEEPNQLASTFERQVLYDGHYTAGSLTNCGKILQIIHFHEDIPGDCFK